MIILNHCLGFLENCHRVSSFECLPSAQGGEFGVIWDYFITTLAIILPTDGNVFWGSREECMFGQQEQEELQCGDYKI